MNPRRLYAPVVLGTIAAGGLAFFAAARTWSHARVLAEGLPSDSVKVTGASAQPIISALAVVAVTAGLAVLAASPRVRRGVGVFTVLVAVAGVVLVLAGGSTVDSALRAAVKVSPAFTGTNAPTTQQGTIWPWVTIVGFVLAAALGAVTTRYALAWPTMSTRYERDGVRERPPVAETGADLWKALDEGRDPTE